VYARLDALWRNPGSAPRGESVPDCAIAKTRSLHPGYALGTVAGSTFDIGIAASMTILARRAFAADQQ
jgi:hypothetical protein